MSITLNGETASRLKRYAQRERRPLSRVVEIAIERMLDQQAPAGERIMTTPGSFQGSFSREDAYEGR